MRTLALALVFLILATSTARSEIIFLRGLFGMAFSPGIIELANKTGRKHYCFCSVPQLTNQIVADFKAGKIKGKVHIVGHSLGADAAITLARKLKAHHIPVGQVITWDATVLPKVVDVSITNFQSRDFRAKYIPAATNYYFPKLNHINLTTDAEVQRLTLKVLGFNNSLPNAGPVL